MDNGSFRGAKPRLHMRLCCGSHPTRWFCSDTSGKGAYLDRFVWNSWRNLCPKLWQHNARTKSVAWAARVAVYIGGLGSGTEHGLWLSDYLPKKTTYRVSRNGILRDFLKS